jgi:elongation factor 1-beta
VVSRVSDLARVKILYRLLPDDAEVGVEVMEKGIEELAVEQGFEVLDTRVEEVAFGIKALKILLSMEEREGILDEVERGIANVENVGSMEAVRVTRF